MPRTTKKSPAKRNEDKRNRQRKLREDDQYREAEQQRIFERRKNLKTQISRKTVDATTTRTKKAVPVKRKFQQDPATNSKRQKLTTKDTVTNDPYEKHLDNYLKLIHQSPLYVCSCCGGLWYKDSTFVWPREKLHKERDKRIIQRQKRKQKKYGLDISLTSKDPVCNTHSWYGEFLDKVLCVEQDPHRLCYTCKRGITSVDPKVPKLCLSNGLRFPDLPWQLHGLSPLEERLVAGRIPFMQIRALGADRQVQLKGNVVNIENDLDICARAIPRKFDETSTIQVKLKRREKDKGHYMYETIRPSVVQRAALYLIETELYKKHKLKLSRDWIPNVNDEVVPFMFPDDAIEDSEGEMSNEVDSSQEEDRSQPEDDEVSNPNETEEAYNIESSEQLNVGAEETLFYEEVTETAGMTIAPGEGRSPIPLYRDAEAEELSFPTIFCGVPRKFNPEAGITVTDVAKSAVRNFDRRACNPTYLLWAFKKSYNEKVRSAVHIFLRKSVGKDRKITAGSLKSPDTLIDIMQKDHGYAAFKNLRSSPPYWEQKKKNVRAMIRQKGKCALFITLYAAESKWTELLMMLSEIVKGEIINPDEVKAMTSIEKFVLIRKDPVTCMRHFDHRYRSLLSKLLKPKGGVFGEYEMTDYFTRLEFQMRGSPHSHGLYWLKDAPNYVKDDPESERACVKFINELVTCEHNEEGEMNELIGYQIHKHTHTCEKGKHGGEFRCRFGFPKPPMPCTKILTPLPKDTYEEKKIYEEAKELFEAIKQNLTSRGRHPTDDPNFVDFLTQLQIDEDNYILAVRSYIKGQTVFLKRKVKEIFISPYNQKLLQAWGANIDVQFILDEYACANYCVGYITKSQGGLSKLLRHASDSTRGGNFTIRDKLSSIAYALIRGSEISSQEAASFVLGLPNTFSSCSTVFVNTSPPEERTHMLKSKEELEKLQDEDTENIFTRGLLERYEERPTELFDVCLADFATLYTFEKSKNKDVNKEFEYSEEAGELEHGENAHGSEDEENLEESDREIPNEEPGTNIATSSKRKSCPVYKLKNNLGLMKKRRVRKILRFRHYGKQENPQDYWREQLMLFVPWISEEMELLQVDPIEKAKENKDLILKNSEPYFANRDIDEHMLASMMENGDSDSEAEPEESDFVEEDFDYVEETIFHTQKTALAEEYDRGSNARSEKFLAPNTVEDEIFHEMMQGLNEKERRFVMEIMHRLKNGEKPFHILLHGGAGVGKSHTVKALVQCFLRYYANLPNQNPEQAPVIVTAFTGKAAFNIHGMTLNSTFKLPPMQQQNINNLDGSSLNTLRKQLGGAKLIIIDEISMVNVRMLYDIDHRLREVFCSKEPFGGISMLVVGHFRQLRPVSGHYIFADPIHLPLGRLLGNPLWLLFEMYVLDEVMRQFGALAFCKALNNMSEGTMDRDDISLINSRVVEEDQAPEDAIWLFHKNIDCDEHNDKVHLRLGTQGATSIAVDTTQGTGSSADRKKLLDAAKKFKIQECDGLRYITKLKIAGQYFVTTNIDVSDGLFNGATGTLMDIDFSDHVENKPIRCWIKFEEHLIGAKCRRLELTKAQSELSQSNDNTIRDKCTKYIDNLRLGWTPINIMKKCLTKRFNPRLRVVRQQIPLTACNGMTIHKAQGSTIAIVVVSLQHGTLSIQLLYVACSRTPTLEGLYIVGKFTPPEKPDELTDPVSIEMKKLNNRPINFVLKFLQDVQFDSCKVYFHNIQSFKLHYLDLQSDRCPMSADYIVLVEPHLLSSDVITINGFMSLHRTDCNTLDNGSSIRNSFRINSFINYIPDDCEFIDNNVPKFEAESAMEPRKGHFLFLWHNIAGIWVIFCYKSPKFSNSIFKSKLLECLHQITLKHEKAVIVGDINIDLRNNENIGMIQLFQENGFHPLLSPNSSSTNLGTHIDICFSNCDTVDVWYYETYYSYHKPICLTFPPL